MENKVYIAVKDNIKIIFMPEKIEGDKVIGYDKRIVLRSGNDSKQWVTGSWSASYEWVEEGNYKLEEASIIESEWFKACFKANKLVEKSKAVDVYPIY